MNAPRARLRLRMPKSPVIAVALMTVALGISGNAEVFASPSQPMISGKSSRFTASGIRHLTLLSGDCVAYVLATSLGNEVVVRGLRSGSIRVIAQLKSPAMVTWLAGDGDWLVWSWQSHMQTSVLDPVNWHVVSANLSSGHTKLLESSSQGGDPLPPAPTVRNGVAAWTHWLGFAARKSDVIVADLATGKTRVFLSHVAVGQVALAGSRLVYLLTIQKQNVYTNIVMSASLTGGVSSPVSSSGHSQLPRAFGNLVVWQEPDMGEPQRLMSRVLPNGKETIALNDANHANVAVGQNFFVFDGIDGQWYATKPAGGNPVRLSTQAWYPCGTSVHNHQVVWGEGSTDSNIRIFTATVN